MPSFPTQEQFKLIIFHFTGAICVHLVHQFVDINVQPEVFFDDAGYCFPIHVPCLVFIASACNIRLHCVAMQYWCELGKIIV